MTETQQTMTEFTYATGETDDRRPVQPVRGPLLAQDQRRREQHARDVQEPEHPAGRDPARLEHADDPAAQHRVRGHEHEVQPR